MKKHTFHAALIIFAAMLMQLACAPAAQAAPGDFLFLWGAQQHFSDPSGVAVDQYGNVFVTDTDRVQVFNSSGTRIRKWGTYGSGDGQFIYPKGIAVDRNGRVYVVDAGNNRVQVFDGAGNFLFSLDHSWWGNSINGIAIDGSGNVYVADTGRYVSGSGTYSNDSVKVFDSAGNFLRDLGSDALFNGANGVAIHVNGNVYVSDAFGGIHEFSPSGTFIRTVMSGELFSCYGIALDRSGNIYVPGSFDFWSGEISIFDNAGNHIQSLKFSDQYVWEHYWTPIAVAVDQSGNAFTLDAGNDGLRAFDSAGKLFGQWWTYGTGESQLTRPTGLAVDKSGKVFETDSEDNEATVRIDRLRLFDSEGTFLRMSKLMLDDIWQTTSGVAVDGGGNVHVLLLEGKVHVFDGQGNFIRSWDSYNQQDETHRLIRPVGIAVDKSGNVLITNSDSYSEDSGVAVFDNGGNFLKYFGTWGTGDGELISPQGIAIDVKGNIFVVDAGNFRVQLFDSAHKFVRKWGSEGAGDGQFSKPSGIAVDLNGNVFVADSGNNRIQVFDSTGKFLGKWGGTGDENGMFNEPRGVAVSQSGARIYVADTGNNRIQVFEGYGTAQTWSVSGTVRQGSSTGPVLAGATVAIAGKTATTGSTGSFTITGVPAGTYTFTISKDGYATKTSTVYNIQSNRSGLVFYLTPLPTYYVSGTVRQGSATGPALAGATVKIAGKTATTYSNGSFKITGIPKGTYTFTISKPGYVTKTSGAYLIQSNRSGLVFYLTPATSTFTVSGTVRQGSATGPALAGATVQIAGKTATTYSNGSFSISGIPAGTYSFTISKTGYITKTTTVYLIQSNRSGLVFYLSPAAAASVSHVRRAVTAGPDPAGGKGEGAGRRRDTYNSPLLSLI